ncbi:MAG: PASTA domain-containing protein, partial [Candidatus Eremiobacteraeota bacterium]|nr:PASTA domain-containing protein [Candidatus Eremiobacteraeota bacterium]
MSSTGPTKRRRSAGYSIPPPKRPSRRGISPGLIVALSLLLVLIVLVSVGAYRLFAPAGSPVELPDFAGMSLDVAQSVADRTGVSLRVVAHHNDDKIGKGDVVGQFPAAGEHVRRGRIVDVVVSDGPAATSVPDLGDLSLRDAQIALGNARLSLGNVTKQKSDTVAAGRILSQDPIALTDVAVGSRVDVVVAQGRPQVYVPNFVGLSLAFSQTAAKQAGVSLGPPLWLPIAKDAKPRGIVIAQDPLPGQPLGTGDKVILHVSGGAPPTPTPSPTATPTEAPVAQTPAPETASPPVQPSGEGSPSAAPVARSLRIQVALPQLASAKRVRIALVDTTGSHDLYDETTKG